MKNVLAITGSETFLRMRAVRSVIAAQTSKQWDLFEVDAAEPGGISAAFSHASLTGVKTLALVQNPDKDIQAIEQHIQSKDDFVILLLHYEGDVKEGSKFSKLLGLLGSAHHKFPIPPKSWDQETTAVAFCISEFKTHGFKLSKDIAQYLVENAGTNIGVLSFEILKIATLAQADGLSEITKQIVQSCLADVTGDGIQMVVTALAERNARLLVKALRKVALTHNDPMILLCRIVESKAYAWLPIAKAREEGLTLKQAAEASGANVWQYMNKLAPQAAQWGTKDILQLLQAMATSERCLLRGAINPWAGMTARLLALCVG